MNTGFNTMPAVHRIDEFVFDCSFDSLAQANALEPEMSALLTAKLLPVIDSILNEFDEADTVWRLDQVEIDIGDIFSDDFYVELMQRVQEKLREKLLRLQDHHRSLDSALIKRLPVQRLSKLQTDLEILRDFLLAGRMPWSIGTTDRHAHENMLQRILQQQDAREAWITLLKRLTATERAVAIGRLVAQFSHRSLETVLAGIAPADARPLLDFLRIYQQAMSAVNAKAAIKTNRIRPVWEQLFMMLLESDSLPGNWATLLDRLIKTIVPRHAQESSAVLESIGRMAAQYHQEGKISGAFHDALQTLSSLYSQHPQHGSMSHSALLRHRNGRHDAARSEPEGIKNDEEIKRETQPETAVSPGRKKQARQPEATHEELYARIAEALQKAGLIDTGFASLLMELPPIERRQRLRGLLQLPSVKPRLPQLPPAALLDIGYWLSPPAALLMERLLAHTGRLYQLPGTIGRITQKHWKQQCWNIALDYLLRETDSPEGIDPAGLMHALAHGTHGETAEAQTTLRAWHEALMRSESHSVMATLLRTLIDEVPEPGKPAEESAAHSGQILGQSTLQQPLHNRLTAGEAIPGQQDLKTLLQALSTGHPEQLRQLYQDLRNGRYDLAAAQLSVSELHSLIEKRLYIQSGTAGADRSVFLQAIAAQADRADDQATYYRLILENLLQEREIDLEAIVALARQPLGKIPDDEESRSEPTGKEAFERAEEAEGTEMAGQVTPEAATGTAAYPTGQSTKPIRTGYFALYSRITAALHKAGLIGEHFAVTATEIKPGELRQHLRAVLRGAAVNGWMEKLPQSVRMEIAYLLSPQAALLNEHLLAHADKLRRFAVSSGKHWEQRLWEASLNYLLAETEGEIIPADYVQALARGVTDEADPRATLRAWYDALEQSKTSGTAHTALQTIFSDAREKDRASAVQRTSAQPEAITKTGEREDAGSPEIILLPGRKKQARQTKATHEELTARITEALQKAGLIDGGFASLLMELPPIERRQRLRGLLQLPSVKPRLPQLPQAALLDIGYWLSPPAALLMERLLAHTGRLYQLPGTTGRITQKHWKQQRWSAALDYLLRETDFPEGIDDLAGFMRALAHGVHGEAAESADAQITLRAWYEALARSEPHSIIITLLRTFIDETPEPGKPAEESAAQSEQPLEENTLQQPSHNRLTAGEAIPGQQDLKTLLQALSTGHPEQLRQLYQDLRNGRYDLAAAQLSASELRNLIENRLHIQSGTVGDDGSVFLQAIAAQADRADDQVIYYRLILENLLQEREIDLEAIVALARQPLGKIQDDEESRGKQTGMEAFKRVEGAEGAEVAGQVTLGAATGTAAYPTGQSTKPIRTGHAALYSRITAALHEAGLIDRYPGTISAEVRLDQFRQRLRAVLRGINMNGWVKKLPQSVRMEIAYLLSPQAALLNEHLLAHVGKLQRSTATSAGGNRKQWEQRLWEASLNYLLAETESEIIPADYVQALARGVADEADPRATLRAWYDALEQNKTSAAIRILLRTIAEASAVASRMDREDEENPDSNRSMAGVEENASSAEKPPLLDWDALLSRAQSADDVREEIYIENAGQVLVAPYLSRLFSMLKLVEDGAFIDRHAAERAVHLLQFMVNEQTRSPEYQLTLNKILCGVKTGIPICAEIDISAHERETIEGLIRGMIQNWKTVGNTSIGGLRETFLQRKGRLQLNEDGMWYLTVEPGVFDMLLDSLPWSYSVIKHGWMERAVHVTWR